jgi:hypothetical protein
MNALTTDWVGTGRQGAVPDRFPKVWLGRTRIILPGLVSD